MEESQLKEIIKQTIKEELPFLFRIDRLTFEKKIQILDARNIQLGKGTGTKIGTETAQKLAFFNQTPVNQPDTVADPSGGTTTDAEARTAIAAIIDRLQELGLIA